MLIETRLLTNFAYRHAGAKSFRTSKCGCEVMLLIQTLLRTHWRHPGTYCGLKYTCVYIYIYIYGGILDFFRVAHIYMHIYTCTDIYIYFVLEASWNLFRVDIYMRIYPDFGRTVSYNLRCFFCVTGKAPKSALRPAITAVRWPCLAPLTARKRTPTGPPRHPWGTEGTAKTAPKKNPETLNTKCREQKKDNKQAPHI